MKTEPRRLLPIRSLFLTLYCLTGILALGQADKLLPTDPSITIKTLDNGFKYYIRENKKPENRAAFRLLVNAGSILEADDQRGLAHFLEHMAFNGTKNFEKLELVNFMERIGMQFGADLNAYTSFDETVYMLEVPMDDAEILNKTFQILEDWAHQISLDPEEIEKERGVVLEEWRLGRGAQGRLRDKQIPVLFHDSHYADRLPIGVVEVIESAKRERFVDFYQKYYRPNLMALVVIGDFETEVIEKKIIDHFGKLTNPENAPERTIAPVPDHTETLFSIETDEELPYTSIQIAYKSDPEDDKTVGDYRRSLVEGLYSGMLNQRLSERVQEANPPYLYAGMSKANMVRGKDMVFQYAVVKEGQFEIGLKALLQEARRSTRDGFTQSELDRTKADFLRAMEKAFEEREKTDSSVYASEYARNFFEGEPIPGIAYELELTQQLLPGISLPEVNQAADDWITETNRVVLFSAPKKDGLVPPTREAILSVLEQAAGEELEKYDDGDLSAPLVAELPKGGTIVSERHHEGVGFTEWILSNDIRVILKPTDFKNDQIMMSAFSPGGHSLVEDDSFVPAATADTIVDQSGLGEFSLVQLQKKLAGKVASVGASIGEQFETLSGSASPKDLETFFQLIYLRFTGPRADEDIFSSLMSQYREYVNNRMNVPQEVFSDAIEKTLYAGHPRHLPVDMDFIRKADLETSFEIYRDRFADASDFTFVIVGAFTLEAIKPLVTTYLASLPDLNRVERGRDVGDMPTRGQLAVEVRKGIEPKSQVRLMWYGKADWNEDHRYALRSLIDVLRIRLREEMREDKGGVYGVSPSGGLSQLPTPRYTTSISFGCNPDNVDDLIQTALSVVEEIKTQGAREQDLEKIRETQLRGHEKGMKENPFWLSNLAFYARHGLNFQDIMEFPKRPESLTSEMIQEAAKRYFDDSNQLIAKLYPQEATKPPVESNP